MDFLYFFLLQECVDFLGEAKFQAYSDDENEMEQELQDDAVAAFDSTVRYASKPQNTLGKPNWMHYNLDFYRDPKNREELIDKTAGYLKKYMLSMGMLGRGEGRSKAADFIRSQWQKDLGYGPRRHLARVGTTGVDSTYEFSGNEMDKPAAVIIPQRGGGLPKGQYSGYGAFRRAKGINELTPEQVAKVLANLPHYTDHILANPNLVPEEQLKNAIHNFMRRRENYGTDDYKKVVKLNKVFPWGGLKIANQLAPGEIRKAL